MFDWFWRIVGSSPRSPSKNDPPRGNFVSVGTCRVCEQGSLGVRFCAEDTHRPLVICEECESIWQTPECEESPKSTTQPDSNCPICHQPIFDPPSHWADDQQIKQLGWGDAIAGPAYEEPAEKA